MFPRRLVESFHFCVFTLVILGIVDYGTCQGVAWSREDISLGLTFPEEIDATVGETVFVKLTRPLIGQSSCMFRYPGTADDRSIHSELRDIDGR